MEILSKFVETPICSMPADTKLSALCSINMFDLLSPNGFATVWRKEKQMGKLLC